MAVVISLVIPAFCSAHVLERCLRAIGEQEYPHEYLEVIVVDDHSPSDLSSVVDEFKNDHPSMLKVDFQRNPINSGRSVTRNNGIYRATGAAIFFLDVDNVLDKTCCRNLAHYFDNPNTNLAVRCNIRSDQNSLINSSYARFFNSRYLGQRSESELKSIDFNNLPSKYFATDAVCVSRSALDALQGFDEAFSEYGCEDEDMGIRLVELGATFKLGIDCHVIDADKPTIRRACERMSIYANRSIPKLLSKHSSYVEHTLFSLLEQPFSKLSVSQKLKKLLLNIGANMFAANKTLSYLEANDHKSLKRSDVLYKFVLTSYYVHGMRQRNNHKANHEN